MSSMFNEHDIFSTILLSIILLYMKVSNWILKDRLEALLQTVNDTTTIFQLIFSTQFFFNMILFTLIDYLMMNYCISTSLRSNSNGYSTSVYLLLGMEFTMLLVDLFNIFAHSILNIYEFHRSSVIALNTSLDTEDDNIIHDDDDSGFNGLEGKFVYEKMIDTFTRFCKTIIHIFMLIPFAMPIMLIKDVVIDIITLSQNINAIWKIWINNKKLDSELPTILLNELNLMDDKICIICMDELNIYESNYSNFTKRKPKMLPCGHVFHMNCLKNWMERSQTCPMCRLPVFDDNGNVLPQKKRQTQTTTQSTTNILNETWLSFPINFISDDNYINFNIHDYSSNTSINSKLYLQPNKNNSNHIIIPDISMTYSTNTNTMKDHII